METSISTNGKRYQLDDGLPRCLTCDASGFEKLKRLLGLNQTTCRKLIENAKKSVSAFPKKKASSSMNRSERDRRLLLELYGDKLRRYDWWDTLLSPYFRSGESVKPAEREHPSLEYRTLRKYVHDYDVFAHSEKQYANVFSEWPDLVEYLQQNVAWADFAAVAWTTIRDRLKSGSWSAYDSEQRFHLTLEAFTVATIVDDERVLRAAIAEVPELATEFGDVLNATHSIAHQSDDVVAQWNTLCGTLRGLSEKAMGDPPTPAVLPDIKNVVDMLVAIEQQVKERSVSRLFDHLLSRVDGFLGDLANEPEFSWLRQTERAEVRGQWEDARQSLIVDQDRARGELIRLGDEVPPALINVRQIAATLRDAIAHHGSLFTQPLPADSPLADRHHHQVLVTGAQQRILSLQERQRHAQVHALSRLCPMGRRFDMEPDSLSRPVRTADAAQQELETRIPPIQTAPDLMPLAPARGKPTNGDGTSASGCSHESGGEPSITPTSQDDSTNSLSPTSEQPVDVPDSSRGPSPKPDESQSGSDEEAEVVPPPTRYTERIADALRKTPPDLAYAVQVCRLLTQLNIVAQPPTAIFKAAMLSDRLTDPDGPVASALEDATKQFPPLSHNLTDYEDEPRDIYVMLMVAATLRPTLLAPRTGAHSVLSELRPTERLARLYDLTQEIAIISRSIQNVRVDSTVIETATSHTAWQESRSQLSEEAADWLHNAPHRTIKYAAATDVWKRLVSADGQIGRMMQQIVVEGSDRSELVAEIRSQLTDKKRFETLVRITDRQTIGRKGGPDIHARALDRLRGHAKHAGEFADRYLQLFTSRPSETSSLPQTLTKLRSRVEHLSPLARGQIKELLNSTSAMLSGAANTAIYAIDRFQMLFETLPDTEPDPRDLVASGLFHYPALSVSRDGFPEQDHRQALETLVTATPVSYRSSFRYRLHAKDYVTSRRIINWIEENEEEDTLDLNEHWDRALSSETNKLRHEIDDTRTMLSVFLSRQHISDRERDEYNAVLVEIEPTDSKEVIFDQVRLRIKGIIKCLERAADGYKKKTRRALSDLSISSESAEYARISGLINDGQTVEANGLIEQIGRSGTVLPESFAANREIFCDFYPEIFETIASEMEGMSNRTRVADRIVDAQRFGGMKFDKLPKERRHSASKMLRTWHEIERKRRLDDPTLQLGRTLFEELGLVVEDISIKRGGRGFADAIIHTSTERVCPIPDFGSLSGGRYRIVFLWDRTTTEDILQHANDSPRTAATILLYFGRLTRDQREDVARLSRERLRSILIVDELLMVFLCGEPDLRARALFACTIPFTYAQPYFTTAGPVPSEMFYGRDSEIRHIAHPNGPNFVYGGRQLGKTALLRAVERTEHRPQEERYAIWIDLKAEQVGYGKPPDAIWSSIWYAVRKHCTVPDEIQEPNSLKGRVEEFVKFLTEHFRGSGRQLLLLLDEADLFFEVDARTTKGSDTESRYRESIRLKRLMDDTDRSIKVVFAGLHNVLRTVEYPNHPLGHFGEAIQVGPLWRDAEALIRQPLLASGYRFESDNLVPRILAQTNYYPNLIQIYCAELIKSMCRRPLSSNGPLYDITETVVDETYRDQNLRQMIRQRFHWTLQLDLRYEVIAYTIAHECSLRDEVLSKGLEYRELDTLVREYWPEGFVGVEQFTDRFRSLLDEMIGLGILRKNTEDRYTLRNPNILPLMGTAEEIEDSLLRDRELVGHFNDSFRAHDLQGSDSPSRSPLECRQADDIRAPRNGVSILCGSAVSGYDSVLEFLQVREARGSCRVLGKLSDHDVFEGELIKQIDRRAKGTTIYVVPDKVPWDERWVRTALGRIQGLRSEGRFARVLFMADPERLFTLHGALAQLASLDWVSLRPWRAEFLRQWMIDVGAFQTTDVEVTKVMESTGGWPALLMQLHHFAQSKGDLRLGIRSLDNEINDPDTGSKWLQDFGMNDVRMRLVLATVAQLDDDGRIKGDDLDEVVSLVADDGVDTAYVHKTLRWMEVLHYAMRVGDDAWRMDPILTRLLRATAEE